MLLADHVCAMNRNGDMYMYLSTFVIGHCGSVSRSQASVHGGRGTRSSFLVERESNPMHFLRHSQYNLALASQRLCLYWKERKALFGPDRAFLPLTLTGSDALDADDILSLQAGFPALLCPSSSSSTRGAVAAARNSGSDDDSNLKASKRVVYCDPGQWMPSSTSKNCMRAIFYLVHYLLSQDEEEDKHHKSSGFASVQEEGINILLSLPPSSLHQLANIPQGQDDDDKNDNDEGCEEEKMEQVLRVLDLIVQAMPLTCTWHVLLQDSQSRSDHSNCDSSSRFMIQQQEDRTIASCVTRLTRAQQKVHVHNINVRNCSGGRSNTSSSCESGRSSPSNQSSNSSSLPSSSSDSCPRPHHRHKRGLDQSDRERLRYLLQVQLGLPRDCIPQSLGGS
ncbi:hypothetical protein ACA910_003335 [Epithemia clementina (nom. ined.)]